jgi:hypothetical protein
VPEGARALRLPTAAELGEMGLRCEEIVELDDDGRLAQVKVVDPSFLNWPALPVSLADTMVPDFPLANKSFNLSYAGNDLSCQETQCDLHHAPIRPARTRSRRTDDDTQLPGRG